MADPSAMKSCGSAPGCIHSVPSNWPNSTKPPQKPAVGPFQKCGPGRPQPAQAGCRPCQEVCGEPPSNVAG
eukprot:9401837-Heterocapsa_arctica.AAC.1